MPVMWAYSFLAGGAFVSIMTCALACSFEPNDECVGVSPERKYTISGHLEHSGLPVVGASLKIIGQGEWTRSDTRGAFALSYEPTSSPLRIVVGHVSGLRASRIVDVASTSIHLRIDMLDMVTVAGRVVDVFGAPAAGAQVTVASDDSEITEYVKSDVNGRFSAAVESGHIYTIRFSDGNGATAESSVDITANVELKPIEATLTRRWLKGFAVDRNNRPLAGAHLYVSEPQAPDPWRPVGNKILGTSMWPVAVTTASDGAFRWSPILHSDRTLMLIAPNGHVGAIDIETGPMKSVTVPLVPPGTLKVSCRGFRTTEFLGKVYGARGRLVFAVACGGSMSGLPPGRYRLTSKVDNSTYASTEVTVVAGQTSTASLAVSKPVSIRGTIKEYPGDTPLPGMSCGAQWPLGSEYSGPDRVSISDNDGRFILSTSAGPIVRVICQDRNLRYAQTYAVVGLPADGQVELRTVRLAVNAIHAEVDLVVEDKGVRLREVSASAARAGFQLGDLVLAVNGIPLSGLSEPVVKNLAFTWTRSARNRWTVIRDGGQHVVESQY